MKPTGQRWHLHNSHQFNAFEEWVKKQWLMEKHPTVQVMAGERSTNQNAMIHALYGQIAQQSEDLSVLDVKRMCKLHYGIGILKAADPSFAEWYDRSLKGLRYEDKILLMSHMPVTSEFTKGQATEYIDTILSEYGKRGYALADPRQE